MVSNVVEGEWKNFIFKMIEQKDEEKVLENFRQVFCNDEPLCNALGCTKNPQMLKDISTFAAHILRKDDKLSFCAIDKTTGQIAGIRVTYIVRSNDPKELPFEPTSEGSAGVLLNIAELGEAANIFEAYDVTEYAELLFTSVNPEYRGYGLVTEIYRRSFDLLRSRGFKVCKSTFTSPITQKLAYKFGFKEHARRDFLKFRNPEGGQLIPNTKPEQVAILMALKL